MDIEILIAILTGGVGLITSIVISIFTFFQAKKIAKLKFELDLKKEKDNQVFKFILTFETDKVNQQFIHLRDFLRTTQILKDRLRGILKNKNDYIESELSEDLKELRETIIIQYSNSFYYLNQTDNNRYAHTIKNLFIKIVDSLGSHKKEEVDEANRLLNEISNNQIDLQKRMEIEIQKLINEIKNK